MLAGSLFREIIPRKNKKEDSGLYTFSYFFISDLIFFFSCLIRPFMFYRIHVPWMHMHVQYIHST